MARKLWPGQNPIGKSLAIWHDEKFSREIVGVVGETKGSLENKPAEQMYVPYAQDATWGSMSIVLRTSSEPPALFPQLETKSVVLIKELQSTTCARWTMCWRIQLPHVARRCCC
jgi:hypothetical protein